MVEYEADDALAAAAAVAAADDAGRAGAHLHAGQGPRPVRRRRTRRAARPAQDRSIDAEGVREKFGVAAESIPDYLALVGDTADGFPGLPGWGAKSAAAVLAKYGHIEAIPASVADWDIPLRASAVLAGTLREQRDRAMLFKDLATLRTDIPIDASAASLEWHSPTPSFRQFADYLGLPELADQADQLATARC